MSQWQGKGAVGKARGFMYIHLEPNIESANAHTQDEELSS